MFPLFVHSMHLYPLCFIIMIIAFTMGTRQGDPLRGALFVLIHFKALCFIISHFPFCLFPYIVDDIHITGPFPLYYLFMNIFKQNFV
jgi:hypothetical protein